MPNRTAGEVKDWKPRSAKNQTAVAACMARMSAAAVCPPPALQSTSRSRPARAPRRARASAADATGLGGDRMAAATASRLGKPGLAETAASRAGLEPVAAAAATARPTAELLSTPAAHRSRRRATDLGPDHRWVTTSASVRRRRGGHASWPGRSRHSFTLSIVMATFWRRESATPRASRAAVTGV
jgi:hypothetical protein